MTDTCIVFDGRGFHREYFDGRLGRWLPDDSWWHPAMENNNKENSND